VEGRRQDVRLHRRGLAGVSLKTDSIETAEMLIDAGIGVKAPYFHRSWVNLPWRTSENELRHRLRASYKLVRSALPKKLQAQLDPFE
jgi:predicted DNA-binding protein (MmcQ/YjbR family)